MSPLPRCRSSTPPVSEGSRSRRARWTRAMTSDRSTTGARTATVGPSFRCARRPPWRAATICRRRASTASGASPGPTPSAARASGAARPGECSPASRWVKADRPHPLIPRETLRWRKLYKGRAAVEREFGRLKNEWALAPLRRPWPGSGPAPRRPDHPRRALLRPGGGARSTARGVAVTSGSMRGALFYIPRFIRHYRDRRQLGQSIGQSRKSARVRMRSYR